MLDFYQSVVIDYLRADRSVFVNTECCLQLNPADNPDNSGPHWYCDAVALNLRKNQVFLCEITYSKTMASLIDRLKAWSFHWIALEAALQRDCNIDAQWAVRPWLFVPEAALPKLATALGSLSFGKLPYRATRL